MKTIKVVIGSNFGDEGKGLMTDYFASKAENGIVVRFNGGAQAGHTVVTPEGKRHVFGHFGSGTLAGLPTYLSSFFIVNPLLFMNEYNALQNLLVEPEIYIDKDCLVTTPYDMMVNQIVEVSRDAGRHGSCGVGINETVVRSSRDDLRITVRDLSDKPGLIKKLDIIRKEYVHNRLKDLGVTDIPDNFKRWLESDRILTGYVHDTSAMVGISKDLTTAKVLRLYDSVIFEGAQGLLLDQNHRFFPHVTRSNTGLKNVRDILFEADLENEDIEVTYMTRCYMTRHGAGPFPTELPKKPYEGIIDATNVPNQYQGTLRFGYIDVDLLSESIRNDLTHAEGLDYRTSVAVTCLDQVDSVVGLHTDGGFTTMSIDSFVTLVLDKCGAASIYESYGPTRDTVVRTGISTPV